MAFGFQELKLSGYDVERIEACHIAGAMGEHTTLTLRALLKEEGKEEAIHTTGTNYPVEVFVEDQGKKTTLFHGIVTKINICFKAEVYWLEIEAKSYTYLMDITKHSRSFQDVQVTYHEVIKSIMKAYPQADFILGIPNKPIGELLVQYEETDWQFIKRLASQFNEGLFPAAEIEGVKVFIGLGDIFTKNFSIQHLDVRKDLDTYYRMKASDIKEAQEVDYTSYHIRSEAIGYLMHAIEVNGRRFYIQKLEYKLQAGLLVNNYEVKVKKGMKERRIYPMHLVGISLEGKILVPQEDKVKVHLNIDKEQAESRAYWFSYSTMSASNDGSGWYCMPEVGDTIRVYFPTKFTKDAVALSAVSLYDAPKDEPDRMSNPDVKYLGTVHDKEMKLAPEGIRIACNGSVAILNVGQNGKIFLYGQKNIKVAAEENLDVKVTKDLVMTALEKIELSCDKGGKVILDESGNIVMQGTKVKVD